MKSLLVGGCVKPVSADRQLAGFIAKYTPEIAAQARAVLTKMRALLPGAVELVYDNYNALVVGFSPNERTSDAIFSVALYPRWVNLFFLKGAHLPDPERLLIGKGTRVRHIVLEGPQTLDRSAVRRVMAHALSDSAKAFVAGGPHRIIIKSVSANKRPRRPRAAP